MSSTPNFVGTYKTSVESLSANHSTRPKRVIVAGSSGTRIHQMTLMSSDSSSNTAKLYELVPMTLQSAMTVGTHVDGGGGSDTITRTAGSFITDGWKVDDLLLVHGSTTLANDYLVRLTGVAALTLTFATSTVNTGEVLPSGAILYKAGQEAIVTVAANSGNAAGTAPIDLLSSTLFPQLDATPNRYRTLGAAAAIAVAAGTALGAGEFFDVTTQHADY